jgi:hypothetical protein
MDSTGLRGGKVAAASIIYIAVITFYHYLHTYLAEHSFFSHGSDNISVAHSISYGFMKANGRG